MTDLQSLYAGICGGPTRTRRGSHSRTSSTKKAEGQRVRADVIRTHCRLARKNRGRNRGGELNGRWRGTGNEGEELELQRELPWLAHLKSRVKAWALERGSGGAPHTLLQAVRDRRRLRTSSKTRSAR